LITCQLTKLEAAFDQIRKTYPKVKPADAALLSSALVVTGRHAIALYDGQQFQWPNDYEKLTHAMVAEVEMARESLDGAKKTKTAPEEEPFLVAVGLMPNFSAGERLLEGRNDLKKMLSEALQEGIEYVYSSSDLGWQWALDHVNWTTVTGGELARKVKVKATFTEGAVGVEMGTPGAKKRPSRAKAKPVEDEAEAAAPEADDLDTAGDVPEPVMEAAPEVAEVSEEAPAEKPKAKAKAKKSS